MSCEWFYVEVFSYLKIDLNIALYQVITQIRMSEFECDQFSNTMFSQQSLNVSSRFIP